MDVVPSFVSSLHSLLHQVLCKKVPDRDLWDLACALMDGLLDYQAHSSNGACVVLNSVLKHRGTALQNRVGVRGGGDFWVHWLQTAWL